jgi:hypothetical protein
MRIPSGHVTKNFKYAEFFKVARSTLAKLNKHERWIQFNPPQSVLDNIEKLCVEILQPLRSFLAVPIRIHAGGGWRSEAYNRAVHGSSTSHHLKGEAADFSVVRIPHQFKNRSVVPQGYRPRTPTGFAFGVLWNDCWNGVMPVAELIHEYGRSMGAPSWVHVAVGPSPRIANVKAIGSYTGKQYAYLGPAEGYAMSDLGMAHFA